MISITEFAAKLSDVEPMDDGAFMAVCPACHGDGALRFGLRGDGTVWVKCLEDCRPAAICNAVVIKTTDLAGEPVQKVVAGKDGKLRKAKLPDPIKVTYDYEYPDSGAAYQVCELESGKQVVRVLRDPIDHKGKPKFEFGLTRFNLRPVPYNLPNVAEAAKGSTRFIFICPSEQDANALISLGCVATCCMSEKHFKEGGWKNEFCDWFRRGGEGCRVWILPKSDKGIVDPEDVKGVRTAYAGQIQAKRILESLTNNKVTARIVELPDRAGKRCTRPSEWVAAGGNKQELIEIVRSAPPWECPDALSELSPDALEREARLAVAREAERSVAKPLASQNASADSSPSSCGARESGSSSAPRSPQNEKALRVDYRGRECIIETNLERLPYCLNYAVGFFTRDMDGNEVKLDSTSIRKIVSDVVIGWLKIRGQFFFHEELRNFESNMYFDGETKKLFTLESPDFHTWIATESLINRSTGSFTYIMSDIHDETLQGKDSRGVIPSVLWERKEQIIYISCGNSKMVRVDGQSVRMVDNGTDGVLFMSGRSMEEWPLLDGPGEDPFACSKLFQGASFESQHGLMLTRLWVLGLFAKHRTKPCIVFTGTFGSGKSRTAKGIYEMIGAPYRLSTVKENGELDFWVSLNDGGLCCFDNVDSRNKWFADAMQAASTDGRTEVRKMYTHEMMQLVANASVMLTSNNPTFATDSGLSDRLIIVRLDKTRAHSSDKGLTDDFLSRRGQTMTWITRTLSKALADEQPIDANINMRHPDFADFGLRCGRACGLYDEARDAMKAAEMDKNLFPIENDFVAKKILETISENGGQFEGTSTELSVILLAKYDAPDDSTKKALSNRAVGNVLSKYKEQFRAILGMDDRTLHGRKSYKFNGLKVGWVGLNGRFAISPEGEENAYKAQKVCSDPPIPPFKDDERKKEESIETVLDADGELNWEEV
jgi:hypothetical protein